MLCQVGIFFALLSRVILDHPEKTDAQSSMLGVLLIVMVVIPLVVAVLHVRATPSRVVPFARPSPLTTRAIAGRAGRSRRRRRCR